HLLLSFELVTDLLVLSLPQFVSAQRVDGAVLCRGHEPRPRIIGDAGFRPLLQRREERVLRQIFRDSYVSHDAREPGTDLARLDSPDSVDGAVRVVGRSGHATQLERRVRRVQALMSRSFK